MQNRVLHWLIDDLGYTFLGNLEDVDNTPVRVDLLRKHLQERGYTSEQIGKAISELTNEAANQTSDLLEANRAVYDSLRYGLQGVRDDQGNRITVHYIEWDDVTNNDFYVAEEVSVLRFDHMTRKRPDLVLYINGIAVGMIELKRSCVSVGEGIRQMLTNQKKENIQSFFNTMQLLIAGNEAEGLRYGVIETPEKFYLSWKEDKNAIDELSVRIKEIQSKESNRLRDGIVSICQQERFLSLLHDFMIFDSGCKKTARHNQYFANIAARARIQKGEGGIIWNTQGSGKSLIMVWLTKWIIENITDSRVVIITDRDELDDQIESLFFDVGEKKVKRAKSCADLRDVLNKNEDNIICSLIHKYGHSAGKQADIDKYSKELIADLPKDYKAKGTIIAFIDECHRTNSGKLHTAVKLLMPDATLIGFTGTPLLKDDKKTSLEVFGSYIHTYKFNEGVEDGVVLDLRYEARDVDQDLSSKDKVDQWFDLKTQGLTSRAKQKLKQSWATLSKLYSSKERLERIVADIIFDMSDKTRLANERGTAMLVAGSILEACKYWEIFNTQGFTKCAIVTSYEPTTASVRTATSDPSRNSEEEYKKKIYERMLNGKKQDEFESEVKELFKKSPAKMKLLIVVDKLLTGFDAPSATYLYIDKKMRDHDLFQAICRVNRPNGEDKDYGYIVDYMDLFRNIQLAVKDYTSEAFKDFDKEDVEGLIKDRYDEAKSEMVGSIASLNDLIGNVNDPKADSDYIDYFCGVDSENAEMVARRDLVTYKYQKEDYCNFAVLYKTDPTEIDKRILAFNPRMQSQIQSGIDDKEVATTYQIAKDHLVPYDEETEKELLRMIGDEDKTLCDCLWFMIQKRGWEYPLDFNEHTQVHENYFSRIRENKANNMNSDTLMAICVGLGLRLRLTEKIYSKSERKLHYYEEPDKTRIRIMETYPCININNFNNLLILSNLEPLGTKEKVS